MATSHPRAQRAKTSRVDDILRRAMARNPHGPIIVSTKKIERLAQYGRLQESAH